MTSASLAMALVAGLMGCASPASGSRRHQGTERRPAPRTPRTVPQAAGTQRAPTAPPSPFSLPPARGPGHLAPGSDPSVLRGPVLIADAGNNRLLLVDPRGRIQWEFPRHGSQPGGRVLGAPDDAFFSPSGKAIVATQELNQTLSVINVAAGHVAYRYGHPGVPGSAAGFFSHPDDAMLLPGGDLLLADIINCRIVVLAPWRWHVVRQFGSAAACGHHPPATFGSPNGAFPLSDGHFLVTEINGDWVDEMSLRGHVYWSAHPPGVAYPSDANEFSPGRYLVADYSYPGQIVIFDRAGRALWRYRPTGARSLNHPSLALPLPGGNILVNDDYNHRVIVINVRTRRIVWQYGHYGVPGRAAGYLNNPDGVDMAPPDSLLMKHAASVGGP
jgi:hypothetical protein